MMQNTEYTAAPPLRKRGRVHDAVHLENYSRSTLLLENGRIVAMGHVNRTCPPISLRRMCRRADIFPALWMRTPISAWMVMASGTKVDDYNEMNDIWTLQLRH